MQIKVNLLKIIGAVIGTVISIAPAMAQSQASEKLYLKDYEAAKAKESACIYFKDQAACKEMFTAYDRAAAAPDATDGVRHEIFKHRLKARAERIEMIAGGYYSQDYVSELQDAYRELLSHYQDGKHAHAIIEHLRLQTQLADQLFFQKQFTDGDRVLSLLRETGEKYWQARTQLEGKPQLKALFELALIEIPRAEKKLAEELSERADSQTPAGDEESHERAIASWKIVEKWVRRQAEMGIRHPMDQRWELEVAEANFKLGFLYSDQYYSNRDEEEAKRRFETAMMFSCGLLDEERAKLLGTTPAEAHEQNTAQDLCNRTLFMLSGKAEEMAREYVDQMIKTQLEILKRKN